jgi:hypothetical protein
LAGQVCQQIIQGVNRRLSPNLLSRQALCKRSEKGETDETQAESEATTAIFKNPPFAAQTPNLESGGDGGKIDSSRDPAL